MSNQTETKKVHNLKLSTEFFQAVYDNEKTFECRINDRNYEVGDELILCEFQVKKQEFTGRIFCVEIVYILQGGQFGILSGYVVMSIRKIQNAEINMDKVIE